jgi:hypothetical protein
VPDQQDEARRLAVLGVGGVNLGESMRLWSKYKKRWLLHCGAY